MVDIKNAPPFSTAKREKNDVFRRFSELVKRCGGEAAALRLLDQLTGGYAPNKSTINRMVAGHGRESSVAALCALIESALVSQVNINKGNALEFIASLSTLVANNSAAANVYVCLSGQSKRYVIDTSKMTLNNGDIDIVVSPKNTL
jgi:hypothetical protein